MKNKEQPLSPGKIWIFKAIGLLLPVLFVVLTEIVLRIFGYGDRLTLMIDYPADHRYLVFNPKASKKYFTNQAVATTGNQEIFLKKKDPKTFRIFVLGESTTIGYPYFHNGSFHRWLQYRLMRSMPESNIEVVNLSLTAVNSWTVLGFAKEIVDYQPDAVLIYAGHNEFYGALGVASTNSIAGSSFIIKTVLALRDFRSFQLLTNAYESVFHTQTAKGGGTRMKMMVADEQIAWHSETYERGLEQFRQNISETLAVLSEHKIPVFISNLVSNEKDLKPFVSQKPDTLEYPLFNRTIDNGSNSLDTGDAKNALLYFEKALQQYPEHALANFLAGRATGQMEEYTASARYYTKAKDFDGLRFRAAEEFNDALIELCKKNSGVSLVDTRSAFQDASPHKSIGNELILEHVHPNLKGYALMSDVFYRRMKEQRLFAVANEISFEQLLRDMPVTKMDSLSGAFKVHNLKNTWPFNEALATDSMRVEGMEGQLAWRVILRQIDWESAQNAMYSNYVSIHRLDAAKKVMAGLVLEHPNEAALYEKTAMVCGELHEPEEALFYFKKAFDLAPSFDNAKFICMISLQQDHPEEAISYIEFAIRHNTSAMNLVALRESAQQIVKLKAQLKSNPANIGLLSTISLRYARMGNRDASAKYANLVIAIDPANKAMRSR